MNRIKKLFDHSHKNLLSVYFTAGYPRFDSVEETILTLTDEGVDLIEVGMPFSDPMADGVVIQNSSHVALQNGMSIRHLFEQLESIRSKVETPLVMMGYLNPIFQYGFENFCKDCARVGVDGLIIPDLPMHDYLADYKPIAERYDLKFIFLITPETSEERIRTIDANTDGFIYMVSSAATTGEQSSFERNVPYFERINAMGLNNPRLVGFGISNKATFETACRYSSGAIIGSAFIKALQSTDGDIAAAAKLLKKKLSE